MKKKIAILGSTGSIGKSLLEIIDKHQSNFEIVLLTANNDYKKLLFFLIHQYLLGESLFRYQKLLGNH